MKVTVTIAPVENEGKFQYPVGHEFNVTTLEIEGDNLVDVLAKIDPPNVPNVRTNWWPLHNSYTITVVPHAS